ncbi:MAG TPA: T9SS type A sorting domain-containing protein, partial [Panacibacter sp.]|nr:T9SS type A sorting domain-containing protein [Panacibacter sp.]
DKLGVIAQEIQKVLPEVVRDWEYAIDEKTGKATKVPSARLGVMYADIIPVLIKGMQEQQQQIEELKQLVSQLSQPQLQNAATVVNSSVAGNISLAQNTPNPFNKTTSIRYNLAPCYKNAQVIVTDNAGRILKQVLLNASGSVNIDGSTLVSGIYNYTLMVDGKLYDTKKMVLAK